MTRMAIGAQGGYTPLMRMPLNATGSVYTSHRKWALYVIKNRTNGMGYVGMTTKLSYRRQHHLSYLRNGKHHNPRLQADFNLHGEEEFEFLVVRLFDPKREPKGLMSLEEELLIQRNAHRTYNTMHHPDRWPPRGAQAERRLRPSPNQRPGDEQHERQL